MHPRTHESSGLGPVDAGRYRIVKSLYDARDEKNLRDDIRVRPYLLFVFRLRVHVCVCACDYPTPHLSCPVPVIQQLTIVCIYI